LLAGKRVIQVDRDHGQIGRFFPVDAAVVGDAVLTADEIVAWLDRGDIEPTGHVDDIERRRPAALDEVCFDGAEDGTVDIRQAMCWLDSHLPENRTLVTDGGRFAGPALQYLHVDDPRAWLYTWRGMGSIGLGMGAAIGAGFGRPGHPVVLVTGDGGFMLGGLAEFRTAVKSGLDMIVVLCNDGGYGAEHVQFRQRGLDPGLSLLDWPDFAPVAEALGGFGVTVRRAADLGTVAEALATRDRPLLIDIKLDPDQIPDIPHG
jgi:acetolactate synthase-1/2/3 large subunit